MEKSCINCKAAFKISKSDLEFYEKISPTFAGKKEQVPPPTLCPDCRRQRRYAVRNERRLYKRSCDLCERDMFSVYSPDKSGVIYCPECWWSDRFDPYSFGRDIDFSRPFFDQFRELETTAPKIALVNGKNENSEYCNVVANCRNCYLIHGSVDCENCYYGSPYRSHDCVDSLVIRNSEWCHECVDSENLYQCSHCQNCTNSRELLYCFGVSNSKNCIGCSDIHGAEYRIFNELVPRERFEEYKAKLKNGDRGTIAEAEKKFSEVKLKMPKRSMVGHSNEHVTGDYIFHSKDCHSCFQVENCQDLAHCGQLLDVKDAVDADFGEEAELIYEESGYYKAQRVLFSSFCWDGVYDFLYCNSCTQSKNLFACSFLRRGEYCILNKRYSKEAYEDLAGKLIAHMRSTGEWGEFFPVTHSPFAYNETTAQEYFPLEEKEAKKRGFRWKPDVDYVGDVKKVIPAAKLPERIQDIPDDILNWAIECEVTGRPFRMIKQELDFYRTVELPAPRLHPDTRHSRRMALRNPRRLYARSCSKCNKDLQTTYSPDRPEIVYCERCYLETVY